MCPVSSKLRRPTPNQAKEKNFVAPRKHNFGIILVTDATAGPFGGDWIAVSTFLEISKKEGQGRLTDEQYAIHDRALQPQATDYIIMH
jgi:hypothetical protein